MFFVRFWIVMRNIHRRIKEWQLAPTKTSTINQPSNAFFSLIIIYSCSDTCIYKYRPSIFFFSFFQKFVPVCTVAKKQVQYPEMQKREWKQQNQCHQKYRSEWDLNTHTHTHLISPAHFSEENRDASEGRTLGVGQERVD